MMRQSRYGDCYATWAAGLLLLLSPTLLRATDIEGVQSASLDQPRIYLTLRRSANDEPLSAKAKDDGMAKLLGAQPGKASDTTIAVEAFLDTGASGVLLSTSSAAALGVKEEQARGGTPVLFHDVGVGGSDQFHVSEPLLVSVAPYHPQTAAESSQSYQPAGSSMRLQLGPLGGGGGLMAMLLSDLDVAGMPLLQGKVMVIDARPLNTLTDTLRTYIYPAGTPYNAARQLQDPGIPPTDRHVALSYVDFTPFTRIEPAGSQRPALVANPFIGPGPLAKRQDSTPPLLVSYKGKTSSGSWLLDTGAAASIISKAQAAALGVTYRAGTEGSMMPKLDGVPAEKQFALTVGGIGGSKKSAGFVLDELSLFTREGDPLAYKKVPVLVADITVENPQTHDKVTLDGVFGMNLLVASAQVSEAALVPDIGKMSQGPYEWIVFNQREAELGLKLRK